MKRPVIIIRPEPGASQTAMRASAMQLAAVKIPVFDIAAIDWAIPDWALPDWADSLLLGSANAVRNAGKNLPYLTRLPVYTVGDATRDAAQKAGLNVRFAGKTNLEEAMDALASDGWTRALRLCGAQHNKLQDRAGINVTTIVNYEARPGILSAEQIAVFAHPAAILVHSARAMEQLEIVFRSDDKLSAMSAHRRHKIIAISERAANASSLQWQHIAICPRPSDGAMLTLAEKLCDTDTK